MHKYKFLAETRSRLDGSRYRVTREWRDGKLASKTYEELPCPELPVGDAGEFYIGHRVQSFPLLDTEVTLYLSNAEAGKLKASIRDILDE